MELHRGEELSEIGFGYYALSGVYGKKDSESFVALIRRTHDLGVTFFGTADIYGPTEEVLETLQAIQAEMRERFLPLVGAEPVPESVSRA